MHIHLSVDMTYNCTNNNTSRVIGTAAVLQTTFETVTGDSGSQRIKRILNKIVFKNYIKQIMTHPNVPQILHTELF